MLENVRRTPVPAAEGRRRSHVLDRVQALDLERLAPLLKSSVISTCAPSTVSGVRVTDFGYAERCAKPSDERPAFVAIVGAEWLERSTLDLARAEVPRISPRG